MFSGSFNSISSLRRNYLRLIDEFGFESAHRQALQFYREWTVKNSLSECFEALSAKRALQFHAMLVYIAIQNNIDLPNKEQLDRIFIELFPSYGKMVVNEVHGISTPKKDPVFP